MTASTLALLLCCGAPLAGCGQKGPLYLPGEAAAARNQTPFGMDDFRNDDARADDASVPGDRQTDRASENNH